MRGRTLYYLATRGVAAVAILQVYGMYHSLPAPVVNKQKAKDGSLLKCYSDAGYDTTCYSLRVPLKWFYQANAKKRCEPYLQPHFIYRNAPHFMKLSEEDRMIPTPRMEWCNDTYLTQELARAMNLNHAMLVSRTFIDRIYGTSLVHSVSNTIPTPAPSFMDIARAEAKAARQIQQEKQQRAQKNAIAARIAPGPDNLEFVKESRENLLKSWDTFESWMKTIGQQSDLLIPDPANVDQQRYDYLNEIQRLEFHIGDRVGIDTVCAVGTHDNIIIDPYTDRGLTQAKHQQTQTPPTATNIPRTTDLIAHVDSSLITSTRPISVADMSTSYTPVSEILFRGVLPMKRPSSLQPTDTYTPPSFRTYVSATIVPANKNPSSTETSASTSTETSSSSSSSPVEDREVELVFGTVFVPGRQVTSQGVTSIPVPWWIRWGHPLWDRFFWTFSASEMICEAARKPDPVERQRQWDEFNKEYPLGPDTYYV